MDRDWEQKMNRLFQEDRDGLLGADPEWAELMANFSMGEVPRENKLTERERMLCILSALLGCQGLGAYRNLLKTALDAGLEPIAVKEMLYQATRQFGLWTGLRLSEGHQPDHAAARNRPSPNPPGDGERGNAL